MHTQETYLRYEQDQRRRGHTSNSIETRECTFRQFSRQLGGRPFTDATRDDVEAFLDSKAHLKPPSRGWHLTNLRCFYRFLILEGDIEVDPTARIPLPKCRAGLPRPMRQADLDAALAAAEPRMRCWLLLAAFGGLRAMEIAGLRREDVVDDVATPLIRILGKGGKERTVPLHPDVAQALVEYGMPTSGPIFESRPGWPMKPGTVSTKVATFLRSIGIAATAHRGRHYYGTEVYRLSGGDLLMVQNLLGHASPATTAVYAAWDQSRAAPVVQLLGRSSPQLTLAI